MKELIEKYQKELFLNREKKVLAISAESKHLYTGKIVILKGLIEDLESLQSKGKTSAEEFLRDKYKLVDFHDLTLNGKPWVELMEEYAQSHANKDGWVSFEVATKLLAIRDALIKEDTEEAYHQLRMIADPNTERNNHWKIWEEIVQSDMRKAI